MDQGTPVAGGIVVGVDGSPSSQKALRWAVEQARLTGATVEAVLCWTLPTVYGRAPMSVDRELGHAAEKVLAKAVGEATGDVRPVRIRETAVLGNASEVLVERSHGADLLVVGSRGRGGFAGALLGSVGQHCVQHARCPVVVVRADTV
ncbi:universal stress protein [Kitasatospora purpeofusca]|uniref:universal stress protein n=1 Tax=Kitasatospora purpeofusca TaxID=67352 RepID=UPI0022523648|nr:universal stress protein [Kitasatospora purpeofusca]MCX4755739.1 universal stress protein [Kitasatospora purpeofusca]WSR36400.1 universal stress protein [Kitasatospora purpeofusca]